MAQMANQKSIPNYQMICKNYFPNKKEKTLANLGECSKDFLEKL